MTWKIRHEGSPQARALSLEKIVEGLRDGLWEPTDEVWGPADKGWMAIENHPQLAEVAAELDPPPAVHEDETNLDFNALIDVCLVLLIFFMMTTTYAVAVQKTVPLPSIKDDQTKSKAIRISDQQVSQRMVRIDAKLDGRGKPLIYVENLRVDVVKDDDSLDQDRLAGELLRYTQGNPRREEVLLDAAGVTWGMVVSIQDAAKLAKVRTIHYKQQAK
jgi:biopolymer transport protein ExbD